MGAESLSPIGMGIGAGADLLKSVFGAYQFLHGNSKLNKLERPEYEQDQNILNNQQLAGQIASQGIPDAQKNFYSDQINSGLGSSLNAITQGGGGLGYVTNALGQSNNSFAQLLAMDAESKLRNQDVLMNANKDVRDENMKAFDYNKNRPYELAYNKWSAMTNSGAQNIFGGLKGIGASAVAGSDALNGMTG